MNILFVADVSISKASSGAERVLFEQSTLLRERGHDVHILTRKLANHNASQEVIQGVREWRYDIDHRNSYSSIKSTLSNCKNLFESLQKKYSFDCINFHQPFSALSVIRSPVNKTVKKIYTCHSLSFEEFQSRNPRPKNIIKGLSYSLNVLTRKYIEKKVLNESDRIVALSRFTQEKLWSAYMIPPEKGVIIPAGVDLRRFSPAINKEEIRRSLNVPENKMILFTVRDLEPRMGLENLIYAIKEVINAMPDIYLVLGGQGPLKNSLISLCHELGVEDHVRLAGFIPEEDLPDYYRMADVFVLPTVELEGFGLITLEALASGIPVLGTPVGGTVEILGKLDSRYLFKDSKPESMTSLIIETLRQFKDNPQLLRDVSGQCRAVVEKHYSWERNVDRLENLFQESLEP
ncbi:MAG: glycosyltransferase family 4 protein [Pseudomonadota bacterium]